jgi:hypothetical protein
MSAPTHAAGPVIGDRGMGIVMVMVLSWRRPMLQRRGRTFKPALTAAAVACLLRTLHARRRDP